MTSISLLLLSVMNNERIGSLSWYFELHIRFQSFFIVATALEPWDYCYLIARVNICKVCIAISAWRTTYSCLHGILLYTVASQASLPFIVVWFSLHLDLYLRMYIIEASSSKTHSTTIKTWSWVCSVLSFVQNVLPIVHFIFISWRLSNQHAFKTSMLDKWPF